MPEDAAEPIGLRSRARAALRERGTRRDRAQDAFLKQHEAQMVEDTQEILGNTAFTVTGVQNAGATSRIDFQADGIDFWWRPPDDRDEVRLGSIYTKVGGQAARITELADLGEQLDNAAQRQAASESGP